MFKKTVAMVLALVFTQLVCASCGGTVEETTAVFQTEPVKTDTVLKIGTGAFSGVFSPFFAKSSYDAQIASVTGVTLLNIERGGSAVKGGIHGEKVEYKGTNYSYSGIADCTVTQNTDSLGAVSKVVYDFTMRDDVVFSDGTPLTADDVIFTMYVLCDPSYNGSSEFNTVPIEGLAEYRGGVDSLASLISQAGRKNRNYQNWTAEQQTAFWTALDEAGERFASSIVDYVIKNYSQNTATDYGGGRGAEIIGSKGLETAFGMAIWGFGKWDIKDGEFTGGFTDETGKSYDCEEEYPIASDFWNALCKRHTDAKTGNVNFSLLDSEEAADKSLFVLLSDIAPEFNDAVEYGENVANISGIVKTGKYSFTVTTTKYDALTICQLAFIVAPLHYYGSTEAYNYEENRFGFTKGDLSGIRSKDNAPLGAGAYKFDGADSVSVNLSANEKYYLGSPVIGKLEFTELADLTGAVDAVNSGKVDICEFSVAPSQLALVSQYNAEGKLGSDTVSRVTVSNNGYGYIGICAKNVLVGKDAGSDESKNLRKAFATILSACREESVYGYYGELADIIEYPISGVSWAAPRLGETGYETAYSRSVDGKAIYTADMTAEQKQSAAVNAAKGFLEAAGYKFNKEGKAERAPSGASLTYTIVIPADGTGEHPSYGIAAKAAELLSEIGITLDISDPNNSEDMWSDMNAGKLDMWAAAWDSAIDPDMYSHYYSTNYPTNNIGSQSNFYFIADSTLNQNILLARASSDRVERRQLYGKCMNIVLDWGVEVPVYQSKHYVLFRTDRINKTTIARNITPFYGWLSEVYTMTPVAESN